MTKVEEKLATYLFIGIRILDKSKKLLKNTLFLAKSNNRGITTGFYDKRQSYSKKIRLYSNS